jgi:hypothetical protein
MTDTISSDESPRWPVFERPAHGGRLGRLSVASQTTAMTAAVSLVLLGGVATVTARSLTGGADPAAVVPASAFAIAQVDLSLPDGQDDAAAHLLARFPGALKGSGSIRDRLLGVLFASSSDPHVDYQKSVKPWLGDHAAVAGWTDDSGAPQVEFALESTDDGAARKALHDASPGTGVAFSHGFAVVAPSQKLAESAVRAADKSSLSSSRTYTGDVAALGGSPVVTAWLDGAGMVKALSHFVSDQPGGLDLLSATGVTDGNPGRVTAGLRLSDDGDNSAVQLDVVSRGGASSHRTTPTGALRHLPATTFAAAAIADPAGIVRDFANDTKGALGAFVLGFRAGVSCSASSGSPGDQCNATPGPPGDYPDPLTEISTAIGVTIPDDLVSLLGSDAVIAYGGLTTGGVPKIGLRSKPADINAAANVGAKLRAKVSDLGLELIERKAGDDFVLATTDDYAGDLAKDGTLGTVTRFGDAMRGMPSSVAFATYVDLGALLPLTIHGAVPQLDHLSALGLWSASAGTMSRTQVRLIVH